MQFNNIYIQDDLFANLAELLGKHINVDNLLLLSDANTSAAYHLYDLPVLVKRHVCLFAVPKVTLKAAKDLGNIARNYDAILAVGSGSINDLAKYAAFYAGVPYVIIASAPSMNGYLSGNASLYDGGIKQSYAALPPRALFADLGVLQNAPKPLIAAGVGDVLCRSSVQYDMLFAHYITASDYPSEIFAQMLALEQILLQKIDAGEDYVQALMDCLIYGGVAMQQYGSSAPASQSEHMLVHLLEMLEPDVAELFHHGQLVGAASIMMLQLQRNYNFAELKNKFNTDKFDADSALAQHFDCELLQQWRAEHEIKLANINVDVDVAKIQAELQKCNILTANELANYLQKIGGEINFTQMGFAENMQQIALYNSAFTRARFTILDLI